MFVTGDYDGGINVWSPPVPQVKADPGTGRPGMDISSSPVSAVGSLASI